jgi:hypothetical protein
MAENLAARLEQAYQEIGQHYGYVACIDEAADRIRELEAALRWAVEWVPNPAECSPEPSADIQRIIYEFGSPSETWPCPNCGGKIQHAGDCPTSNRGAEPK